MRSLVVLALLVVVACPFIIPQGRAALLGGALCKPCVDLITNGENNAIGDFNTWFEKEITWLCSPLGALKNECIKYFRQYEQDFDHFITSCADPKTSCISIDFCDNKTSIIV